MAVSEVSICNSALLMLGDSLITLLTEDSNRARVCNHFYPQVRDELQEIHPWNFNRKRANLASTDAPLFEFSAAFQVPDDYIRLIETDLGTKRRFKVEEDTIVCDAETLQIIYNARITDPAKFPQTFRNALEFELKSRIAFSITRDLQIAAAARAEAETELDLAKLIDAKQGSPDLAEANDLIDVR